VAVVGIRDNLRGHIPLGLFVTNEGCTNTEEQIRNEVVAMVREKIGPVAFFKSAVQVTRLPKTRSGKILRTTIRSIANGDEYKVPATIESTDTIDEIIAVIKAHEEIL
jgi:propionyl-CoA synthetase